MVLEGQVLDVHTGYPVEGAEITCAGPDGMVQGHSDDGGYFKLTVKRTGPWYVSVQKSPYSKESRGSLLVNRDLFLNFSLAMEGLEDEAVTA